MLAEVIGVNALGVVWGSVGGWEEAASTSVVSPRSRALATVAASAQPLAGQATSVTGLLLSAVARIEEPPELAAATAALSRLSAWLSATLIRSGSP